MNTTRQHDEKHQHDSYKYCKKSQYRNLSVDICTFAVDDILDTRTRPRGFRPRDLMLHLRSPDHWPGHLDVFPLWSLSSLACTSYFIGVWLDGRLQAGRIVCDSWGIQAAPQPYQTPLWRGAAFHVPSLLCSSLPTLRSIRVLRASSSSDRAAGGTLSGVCWRQLSLLSLFPHSICHTLAGPRCLCREADSLERVLGLLA